MIQELNNQFAISSHVRFEKGQGGLPKAVLHASSGNFCEVYLHGAHVTSWRDAAGAENLFMSEKSEFGEGLAFRGGIPICFPQFADQGDLPKHGLIRDRAWKVLKTSITPNEGSVSIEFDYRPDKMLKKLWPHLFECRYLVELNENLTVTLTVSNRGNAPFRFQTALHTYFSIQDIRRVKILGLQGLDFTDSLKGGKVFTETREAVDVSEETDRIYKNIPSRLCVLDDAAGKIFQLTPLGLADAVVWNPWIDKARRMVDFGDDEYLRMICLETANIHTRVQIAADERWMGKTVFTVQSA